MSAQHQRIQLREDWSWRLAACNGDQNAQKYPELKQWHPARHVPSVIQADLLQAKAIPDYRLGSNEKDIQWIPNADWEYSCKFKTPDSNANIIDLVFEGLDVIATVVLNGREILSSENQFIPQRVSVKNLLKTDTSSKNELSILFHSVSKHGKMLEEKYGKRKSIMRDPIRCHFRKSAYHWGWDWGPIVVTAGPWKPVYLDIYNSRISDINVGTTLSDDHKTAQILVGMSTAGAKKGIVEVKITDNDNVEVAGKHIAIGDKIELKFSIADPRLWWPNGQGQQHLYTVQTVLRDDSAIVDTSNQRFGIRTISVIQRPLDNASGSTFLFNVNGRDIFSQGACWIPADNLLHTVSRQRYYDWIKLAKYAGLNMIRVWGGGIYESDDFFDACDEYGILVWHDFAFACGDYPTHQEYLDSIKQEAETQVKRLRNRASLALLCGNNEDFMLCDWTKEIEYDFKDTTGPFLDQSFPQREIYLRILPEICESLCPSIKYWPSSPWGGEEANDLTVGDVHQWAVWHADQKPYQEYKNISGRFMSEFGMHAFPVERTVSDTYFGSSDAQELRHPQSERVDCRNKGHGAETRLARYLAENFRYDTNNLSNWIYSTQLLQSEAYGYAYRDLKRKFAGKGKEECAGALVWQFNDVYPTTSWAFVDYYLRPKPSFYTIRRTCAAITVGCSRNPPSRWINEDKPYKARTPSFEIFAHNTTTKDQYCVLEISAYDMKEQAWTSVGSENDKLAVVVKSGYNTELHSVPANPDWTDASLIVLQAKLVDGTTLQTLARFISWPEPFRYVRWPKSTKVDTTIQKSSRDEWEDTVTINANQPIKGYWMQPVYDGSEKLDDGEPQWEDNMVDLMPGEKVEVGVNGLRGRPIKARFLYDWEL